jgi:phosphonoacetaldehyde hydrolase
MLYAKIESSMTSAVAHHAELIPGFRDTLKDLRQRDIKIGTSTGYPGPVMEILTQKALSQGFEPDAVFCASDVPVGRPYPWMCFKNAVALQVYPMEAMVKIGDTIADIHEGLNAGMWTIGLTQSGNEMGLTESEISRLSAEELQQRNYAIARRFTDAGAHYTAAGIWECLPIIEAINGHLSQGHQPL